MFYQLTPFEHRFRNMQNYFDDFEKSFEKRFNKDFESSMLAGCTDIIDNGDNYVLQAELPGFNKEDISVSLENDCLVISAKHDEEKTEKDKKGTVIHSERNYGMFSRKFDISGINAAEISGEYKNGILELTLPKQDPQTPSSRQIEIK
ncbi:MAG: Hsp20/alpha crystallin family protein [Clostridia bacterium]